MRVVYQALLFAKLALRATIVDGAAGGVRAILDTLLTAAALRVVTMTVHIAKCVSRNPALVDTTWPQGLTRACERRTRVINLIVDTLNRDGEVATGILR